MSRLPWAIVASIGSVIATDPLRAADLSSPPPEPPPAMVGVTPDPRYYLALRGGLAWTDEITSGIRAGRVETTFDMPGGVVAGAFGIHLDRVHGEANGLRGEIEVGHIGRTVDSHGVGGVSVGGKASKGSISTNYAIASLYYDFTPAARATPFIGAGAGLAEVEFDKFGTTSAGTLIDDRSTHWIFHGTAGVSARPTPRWQVEAAYRMIGVPNVTPRNTEGTRQQIEMVDHLLMFGARAHF